MNRLWVRLTLAFVAVTLVAIAVIAGLVDWSASNEFRQYLARQDSLTQSGLLDDLAAFYLRNGTWDGAATLLVNFNGLTGRGRGQGRGRPPFLLADASSRVVYDERGIRTGAVLTADERESAQAIISSGKTLGYLVINSQGRGPLAPAEQSYLDQLRLTLLVAALVAGTLGIGLGVFISRSLAAPLNDLARSARAFAKHDWNRRVKASGADEILDVAHEFNEMADELQRAEMLRRNLIADIAHEFRTPLTVLQGNLRAMLDDVYPLNHGEIATLYDETRLLNRLVDDLRELALADAGQLKLDLQDVDLGQILRTTKVQFAMVSDSQNICLDVESGTDPIPVRADPDRLAQVLRNLVSNALRHTPSDGRITISTEQLPLVIRVAVADTGEGIAADDLAHVFERFYRGDKSRTRSRGGTGLGLAIAKAWVDAMGGEIGVESKKGIGSRFWFTLPVAHSP